MRQNLSLDPAKNPIVQSQLIENTIQKFRIGTDDFHYKFADGDLYVMPFDF